MLLNCPPNPLAHSPSAAVVAALLGLAGTVAVGGAVVVARGVLRKRDILIVNHKGMTKRRRCQPGQRPLYTSEIIGRVQNSHYAKFIPPLGRVGRE